MPIIFYDGRPKEDPNMYYAGKVLPRDAVAPQQKSVDFTNVPDMVTLGVGDNMIELPGDVIIYISGAKLVADAQILDGVELFQHVARKAREVNLEFTCWDTDANGNTIFPQNVIDDLYNYVINPNSVINISNTLLNRIGISQLIVLDHNLDTVRGSAKSPGRIKCKENIPGNSLIVDF